MHRHRIVFALAAALAVAACPLAAPPAAAQTDQTGLVEGRVVDAAGEAVADAVVLATFPDGSYPQTAVSDAQGRFRLGFLKPGSYNLSVQAAGYQDQLVEGVRVRAAESTPLLVDLGDSLTEFTEQVTVTAARPLLETSSTDLGSTLDGEEIAVLPISRTATGLVGFTPGARNSQVWGGSTSQANAYQLDGVSVNQPGFGGDFLLPNVDWIEQLEVKGLGAGAEYGNFQGGLINIVTKSGSNTLEGGARFNLEDESLSSSNLDLLEAGEEQDRRWEINADLGGPAKRDALYYYVSAQQVEVDTRIVDARASEAAGDVRFLPVDEERTETKLYGKLSWQASERDRADFVLGYDDVETENRGLDSFTDPAAAQTQDSPAYFYNASWQRVVSGSSFFELRYNGYRGENDFAPQNGDIPAVQILGGNRDLFTNAIFTREREPENDALKASWDALLTTGSVEHRLKLGGEYAVGSWLETRRRNGGLTWRPEEGAGPFDPDDPATWGFISSDWGGDIRLDAENVNAALYVQDYIDLTPRLTLSAGVRWGLWEGEITPGFSGGAPFTAVDDSAFDPRLGLVYDLTGDGRWVGKAHWGRFHQSLFALMYDRVVGSDAFRDTEFWDWIGPGLPELGRSYTEAERGQLFEFFDAIPTGQEVGPVMDYDQPYVDELMLSVETAVGERWRFGLTYLNRQNEKILALVDRNLATNYTRYDGVSVVDFTTGEPVLDTAGNPLVLPTLLISNGDILRRGSAPGLTAGQIANLTFDQELVLTNADDASRELDQLLLTVDRRGARWSLFASLAYTELEGSFYSVSGYEDPGGTGAGAFVEPNLMTNFDGTLPNTNEWEVKVRLFGDLPWGLRGGTFLTFFSGEPFTPTYTIDTRRHDFFTAGGELINFRLLSGVNGETIFLEPRGSRELEESLTADVHLERPFAVGGSELVLALDVFNLFNEDAVTAVRSTVNNQDPADPTTLFGATRFRQTPRTVRLGFNLRW